MLIFKTDPSNVYFLVEICNNHGSPNPSDNYLLRSYNNLPLSNGIHVDHIAWQLDDDTCTAISSIALPTTPPRLGDWQSIFGLTLTGYDPSDEFKTYFVRAHVNKVTAVNEKESLDKQIDISPLLEQPKFITFLERTIKLSPLLVRLLPFFNKLLTDSKKEMTQQEPYDIPTIN
jgi:hypothetical protein